jgi:biopolymer transport protein ExbB
MWELLQAGGVVMIPIGLCSLIGLGVLLERIFTLRRSRIIVPEVAEAVETLGAGSDFAVARAILARRPGPFATIVRAGLEHAHDDWQIIRDALQEAGRQQAVALTRNLVILETVAAVAPLLGLLGTVTGMIRVFSTISAEGLGQAQDLSGGISEAMITTAAGLIIGIPALVAHNWLWSRAEAVIFELEVYGSKVLDTLRARGTAAERGRGPASAVVSVAPAGGAVGGEAAGRGPGVTGGPIVAGGGWGTGLPPG